MKALHIISGDLWAGAEVQAFTLLTALQKRPRMQVAAALMNEGELARRLRAGGIPVTVFPESAMGAVAIIRALRRLMLQWRPDIVHSHRGKENILGSIANRLARNAPSLRSVHGAPENIPRGVRQAHKRLLAALDRFCGRRLQQKLIAVSGELAEKLARDFSRERIVVVENGIDAEAVRAQVHPVEWRTQEPQATHVGFVGRLVAVKRVDLFIATAQLLKRTHPQRDWRFHVFGDGPLRERFAASDSVTFHGHRNDIVACIAALDTLVMCSDHEGLPMTLLEALAVGTPIAAHAVGGIPALLQINAGGMAVEQHDSEGYALAVRALLEEERHDGNIAARYSAMQNAARIAALYEELVEETAA